MRICFCSGAKRKTARRNPPLFVTAEIEAVGYASGLRFARPPANPYATAARGLLRGLRVIAHRRAGAHEIAIAMDVVEAAIGQRRPRSCCNLWRQFISAYFRSLGRCLH